MIYPDFFAMADAILAHVAATGDKILCCDSPRCLLIGFAAQNDHEVLAEQSDDPTMVEFAMFRDSPDLFAVRLTHCKARAGTGGLTDSEQEAWSNYMRTAEGRRLMAEAFSRGERLWSHRDTVPASPPV